MTKLSFKGNEIIFLDVEKEKTEGYQTGAAQIVEAVILYTGGGCKLGYKAGDTVLYKENIVVEKLELLGTKYIRMPEMNLICTVEK